jgi:hypothetical protein
MQTRTKRALLCLAPLGVALGCVTILTHVTPGDHSSRTRCEVYQWVWRTEAEWSQDCRKQGWQAAGAGALRTTGPAQTLFFQRTGRYAGDYDELIEAGLAHDVRATGYEVRLRSSGGRWSATSVPACPVCAVGGRSFYVDETGALRVGEHGEPPPSASSPPL